jgi:ABC-type polysaccharide transport system permease subunit
MLEITDVFEKSEKAALQTKKAEKASKPGSWGEDLKKHWQFYLMILPAFILVLVFSYGPMFGITIAFKDYSPARGFINSPWVGFKWFETAFNSPFFINALKNTVIIKGGQMLVGVPAAVLLALLLNEVRTKWFKSTVQASTVLPYFISWVIVGTMFRNLLTSNGALNEFLVNVLGMQPFSIYDDPERFRILMIVQDTWKFCGYFAMIYLASISGIDPAIYEASLVDGANRWQQMRYVTLPGIKPTFITLVIWLSGYLIVGSFEQIFVQYNVSVYPTADILETLTYRMGLARSQYSLGAAVGLFQSLIAVALMFSTNRIIKAMGSEDTIF